MIDLEELARSLPDLESIEIELDLIAMVAGLDLLDVV